MTMTSKFSVIALGSALICSSLVATRAADLPIEPKKAAQKTTSTEAPKPVAQTAAVETKKAEAPPAKKVAPELVEAYLKSTFGKAPPEWQARIVPDEAMKICNTTRNSPSPAEADKIMASEMAKVVLPADGNYLGDWKSGAKIANNGRGGQFSDDEKTVSGGNCYACHQMEKAEVSFGTLGPSLTDYGKRPQIRRRRDQAGLHQDLQFAGGDRLLQHAAVRQQQGAERAADQGRDGVPVRSGIADQQVADVIVTKPGHFDIGVIT